MRLLRVAYRNIFRNKQRLFVTIAAMVFAGFIMIFFLALMEGFMYIFERNIVQMNLGDMQIHTTDYRSDPDLYKRIENYDGLLKKLDESGFNATPRLYGFGLAASGNTSSGVSVRGVDLVREPTVTELSNHVMKGMWLSDDAQRGVVIGRQLARTLHADIGSEIVFVGQAGDGSMANDIYEVRGILKSVGSGIDGSGFFMVDTAFRELMLVSHGTHEITIMRKDKNEELFASTDRLRSIVAEFGDYEVKNWKELQPLIAELMATSSGSMVIFVLIFYGAVGMIILNATLMSVFERMREFGVMKALGVSPFQIVLLILTEAGIQVTIACLFALLTGMPVAYYYQEHGMDFSSISGTATMGGIAFDPTWYCIITEQTFTTPVFYMYFISGIAVIYPAIKAARIIPVKAIYYR